MKKIIATLFTISILISPFSQSLASDFYDHKPDNVDMALDATIGRPLLLGVTAVGAIVFIATLPFTLLGGNVQHTADILVVEPARATFVRCLGCTDSRTFDDNSFAETHYQQPESEVYK